MTLVIILCLTRLSGHPVCLVDPSNLMIQEDVPGYHHGTVIQNDAGLVVVRERLHTILDKLRRKE